MYSKELMITRSGRSYQQKETTTMGDEKRMAAMLKGMEAMMDQLIEDCR